MLVRRSPEKPTDRVPIDGDRLRDARKVVAGLSTHQVSARLPSDGRVTHAQIVRWERGQDRNARRKTFRALARVLGVAEAWLGGEDVWPLPLPANERTTRPQGPRWWLTVTTIRTVPNLRRAVFTTRCVRAARRDARRFRGRAPRGPEWRRREAVLVEAFYFLPDRAHQALGLTPPLAEEDYEAWEAAAFTYWAATCEPWWEGRVGFDYWALRRMPGGPYGLIPDDRAPASSPWGVLDDAPEST